MSVLATIGGVFANATVGKIFDLGGKAIDGYFEKKKAEIAAMNTQDRQAAELAVQYMQAENEARRIEADLIKAEQGSWFSRSPRPMIGWIVVLLLAKILIYDKALGQWTGGRTDPLDVNLWWVVTTVIIAYFGSRTVEKLPGVISAVFTRRK